MFLFMCTLVQATKTRKKFSYLPDRLQQIDGVLPVGILCCGMVWRTAVCMYVRMYALSNRNNIYS